MNKAVNLTATVFGVGRIPGVPGTYGSLVAVVAWFAFPWEGVFLLVLTLVTVIVAGTFAASIFDKYENSEDNSAIVIDEVAGMWLALLFVPDDLRWVASAFLLFRLFDVIKPFPARRVENLPGGIGVMADDLIAGFYAGLALYAVKLFLQ